MIFLLKEKLNRSESERLLSEGSSVSDTIIISSKGDKNHFMSGNINQTSYESVE